MQSKEKILVILDDVWNKLELKDIGLSPLPSGIKLLLTSRYARICIQIADDVNSIFQIVDVKVLHEMEARNLFYELTRVSEFNVSCMKLEVRSSENVVVSPLPSNSLPKHLDLKDFQYGKTRMTVSWEESLMLTRLCKKLLR